MLQLALRKDITTLALNTLWGSGRVSPAGCDCSFSASTMSFSLACLFAAAVCPRWCLADLMRDLMMLFFSETTAFQLRQLDPCSENLRTRSPSIVPASCLYLLG